MLNLFKNHQKLLGLLILLIASTFIYSFLKPATPTIKYLKEKVKIQDIVNSVEATGSIKAYKVVNVGAQANGQIKKLNVKIGDLVEKGQVLVEIDGTNQENSLKDARAQIQKYSADIESKAIAYDISKQKLADVLFSKEVGATTKTAVLEAQAQVAQAKAELAASKTGLAQAQITEQKALQELRYITVKAPLAGTVISVPVSEGQTIISAQASPTLVTIADTSKMLVKAEIAEADVLKLPLNSLATFFIPGSKDPRYAKVVSIDPAPLATSDNTTSSSSSAIYYYADILTDNASNDLKIGMTAKISIIKSETKKALTVPNAAIKQDPEQGYYVEVLTNPDEAIIKKIKIKIGDKNSVITQILEGVKEGDVVVYGTADTSQQSLKSSSGPRGPAGPF